MIYSGKTDFTFWDVRLTVVYNLTEVGEIEDIALYDADAYAKAQDIYDIVSEKVQDVAYREAYQVSRGE